ncbi:MAG TPA: hypothetical protein PLA50_12820, partial [Bacteroidia bacterium]|nr:hypothetical protein [Bacteroidia bacterium]
MNAKRALTFSKEIDLAIKREDLPADLKAQLSELKAEIQSPLNFDVWIYRSVVWILGSIVLVTVTGGVILAGRGAGDPNIAVPQGII